MPVSFHVFFFSACTLNAHTVDALSSTQSCFVCVLRRNNKMLTKETRLVKFNSLTIQTFAKLLLAALLYCVSLGIPLPGSLSFQCTQDLGGVQFSP